MCMSYEISCSVFYFDAVVLDALIKGLHLRNFFKNTKQFLWIAMYIHYIDFIYIYIVQSLKKNILTNIYMTKNLFKTPKVLVIVLLFCTDSFVYYCIFFLSLCVFVSQIFWFFTFFFSLHWKINSFYWVKNW